MSVYYNENDQKAVAWLRELIKAGLIADGIVDDRSIADVQPRDLGGFKQHHFFAGVGGWSLAMRLAGWADSRPVWTASCPCQPFSAAGKRKGEEDERHLWPELRRLVAECKPAKVFGEQVASSAGRAWFAGVRADLEALGYAAGAADLCAASVGAPHIRQRLYWVADSMHTERRSVSEHGSDGCNRKDCGRQEARGKSGACGEVCRMGDASCERYERQYPLLWEEEGDRGEGNLTEAAWAGSSGFWSAFDILNCTDNKARRIESGTFPLVAGLPKGMVRGGDSGAPFDANHTPDARVMRLRGYGNSIIPQLASAFILAAT